MPTFSEKGHAKNVANFQSLISFTEGYGPLYNPSKTTLKLTALNTLFSDAQSRLAQVITTNTGFNNAVNQRMIEFSTLKPLGTRIINALQATDAAPETIKDAKTLNRKLQGKRASPPEKPTNPDTPAPNTISSSQQSYDQQIQHLAGIIAILKSEPSYTPNETGLTTESLIAKQDALSAKNAAVATAYTTVSNARIERNETLYNTQTGLVHIASEIKKYVKSVFGASSPQYHQVQGIEFHIISS